MFKPWQCRKITGLLIILLVFSIIILKNEDQKENLKKFREKGELDKMLEKKYREELFKDLEECSPDFNTPQTEGQQRLPDAVIIGVKKVIKAAWLK